MSTPDGIDKANRLVELLGRLVSLAARVVALLGELHK